MQIEYRTKRERYEALRSQLETERASFIPHWQELADFILPRRPRFLITDTNKGDRRSQKIIDSAATKAARTLRSGMMSGITSPARRWFRLTTPDPEMAEYGSIKRWLATVTERMETVLLKTNFYNAAPIVYGDLGVFGTGATLVEEDFDSVLRFYPLPIGSYMIANDDKLRVRIFVRDFQMTVRQLLYKFGKYEGGQIDWSNFSSTVRSAYDNGQLEQWIQVCHIIMPNDKYDPERADPKFKQFTSCYYERGAAGMVDKDRDVYLRESGYDWFPVLPPRWEVTGEDVYGTTCPGMESLGDVKQLQKGEKLGLQAITLVVKPPMTGPSSLKTVKTSTIAGDITYLDEREGVKGFRPTFQVDPRIMELEQKQEQVRNRVRSMFYEDLFLMMTNIDRREITAREIQERHDEKLMALGPVLEQLNQDFLDPLIDIQFAVMLQQGLIPPPPEELEGAPLKVEYMSIMAEAQKLVGIGGIERFSTFVGGIMQSTQDPATLDKVNVDQLIDVYGDWTSVPPSIIRTDEEVEVIRQQRAQQQQAMATQQAVKELTAGAKNLSQAKMGEDNALTRLLNGAQAA